MSFDRGLGVAGVALSLIAGGLVWLFPSQRWIGWSSLGLGVAMIVISVVWILARHSDQKVTIAESIRLQQEIRQGGQPVYPPVQVINSPIFNNAPQIIQHPVTDQTQSTHPVTEPGPNLALKRIFYLTAHQPLHSSLLFEGQQTHPYPHNLEPDNVVLVLEICNEFSGSQLVGPAQNNRPDILHCAGTPNDTGESWRMVIEREQDQF